MSNVQQGVIQLEFDDVSMGFPSVVILAGKQSNGISASQCL